MPVFDVACALLVVAGVAKALSPDGARDAMRLVGLSVPAALVRALAVGEVGVGVLAAVRPGPVSGAMLAGAYAVFCVFVVLVLRAADRPVDCGCFADGESGAGALHVSLNAVACAVGVLAALSPPPGIGWILGRPALVALPLSAGLVAASLAGYLVYTGLPHAWRAYGTGA